MAADFPTSATFLFASFLLYRHSCDPRRGRAIAAGAALGLALITKFTAILLCPLFVFVVVATAWREKRLSLRETGLELGFVFGTIDATKSRDFCGSGPECDALEEAIQESWLAFAKTGNPGNPKVGDWPRYGEERETMILGASSRIEEAPYEAERLAWEGVEQVGTL